MNLRKLRPLFALSLAALCACATPPAATQSPTPAPTPSLPPAGPPSAPVDASAPIPKKGNARFFELHESFLARGKAGPIGVLFLGDSITEGWRTAPHIWEHHFGRYQPANFGIGGDQTHHVIWRIENGEFEGISPRVVVLMLGTNNSRQHTGEQIAAADRKIIELIQAKIPGVKVLLLAIFPRDARRGPSGLITEAAVADAGKRMAAIDRANALLAKLDDGVNVRFLDIGAQFLGKDSRIPWVIMPDQLHLSPGGYQLWADAMQPLLDEMMK